MLDSVNTSQPDLNASTKALLSSDYELNGTINRAASEGAKFALMVAMLEQNCMHRPHLDATKEIDQIAEVTSDLNYYRSNPLSANDAYWQTCQHTSQLIYSGQLHSAQLWLAMHPEPLSQYNKPDAINEDVIANCSVNTQTRMQQAKEKVINIDETGLYDILQELEPISTQAIYNVS
ncbi:VC2046/SO_2500 family protein [Paraglaciecola psychrophila]|uniref:Uncharacterized protein n=1 Tax=Paraglaciecola psychrophila 170 TaxID=1129794 RepID=K7A9N6_9ALTE|nr:VC2046/SO_2500 family protein [Paraglaciecola psychrophila]AGH42979.1 hypothetical protein C427_0870 [Paraglaciecola psychrophila 170]GAC39012.1 hypothetical protein GPSY_3401 [Paraglaciecola psychrophila 170]